MTLATLPLPELLQILRATEQISAPNSDSVRAIRRELARRQPPNLAEALERLDKLGTELDALARSPELLEIQVEHRRVAAMGKLLSAAVGDIGRSRERLQQVAKMASRLQDRRSALAAREAARGR